MEDKNEKDMMDRLIGGCVMDLDKAEQEMMDRLSTIMQTYETVIQSALEKIVLDTAAEQKIVVNHACVMECMDKSFSYGFGLGCRAGFEMTRHGD